MTPPAPYTIAVAQHVLDRIARRLRDYRWDALPDAGGWQCGVGVGDLRGLCDYWLTDYDWRAQERRLNRLAQFIANVDGIDIHFYHVRSNHPDRALIMTHGWPGSVVEFLDVIEPLAHPEKFGGDAADGFDVIVPALPGFGFSGRPPQPIGPRAIARIFAKLMTDVLGYTRYIAQGGDWGSGVSTWMALDDPAHCRGLHLNMLMVQPTVAAAEPGEQAWLRNLQRIQKREGAYLQLQATRPQTLAAALMDSPVGIAAWILEKFGAWADIPRDDRGTPELGRFSVDDLLTNIMLYVATDAFATSTWIYYGMLQLERSHRLPEGIRCTVPTGFAAFPDPLLPPPPRSLLERGYNLIHYTSMPRGGHFAALEQPTVFVEDIRRFTRTLDTR